MVNLPITVLLGRDTYGCTTAGEDQAGKGLAAEIRSQSRKDDQGDTDEAQGDPEETQGDPIEVQGGPDEQQEMRFLRILILVIQKLGGKVLAHQPHRVTWMLSQRISKRNWRSLYYVLWMQLHAEQIVAMQQADSSLKQIRDLLSGAVMEDKGNSSQFHYHDEVLHRIWKPHGIVHKSINGWCFPVSVGD
jgi:hypothetical protein